MSSTLKEDLRSTLAYPHVPMERVEFIETHISWVFLGARDVFKAKRPVNLGFLDFSTLELRKKACEAEILLNRRLAPDIYLGIVPITRSPDGRHRVQGDGPVVDWAVHMVRIPDSFRADDLLVHGKFGQLEIDLLACHLADFHAHSRCDPETSQYGRLEVIERNIRENFDQTRTYIQQFITGDQAQEVEAWQLSFLQNHRELLEVRVQSKRVRDGHGDLRLQQIYLPDGNVRILDCIEFNDRFRYADVCADIAFLAMDLNSKSRIDLAERLLAIYAREANDFDLYGLVDFYESYRAYVRGKVAMFLANDPEVLEETRLSAHQEARHHFLQALSVMKPSLLRPSVVAVGGILATGKSTLADWLGMHLSAPVVDADRTRKHLLSVRPTQHLGDRAWAGAYNPEFTEKVYVEVFRRAEVILRSGRPAVLDASFRSVKLRKKARDLAQRVGIPFRFVECRAPAAVCRERLLAREREPGVSDARADLLADFTAHFEPASELPESEHVVADTSGPLHETTGRLKTALQLWPDRLTA